MSTQDRAGLGRICSARTVRTMKNHLVVTLGVVACTAMPQMSAGQSVDEVSYDLIVCDDAGSPAHAVGVGLELLIKLELLPTDGLNMATTASSSRERCLATMSEKASTFAIMDRAGVESASRGSHSSGDASDVRPLLIAGLWQQAAHFVIAKDHLLSGTIGDFAQLSNDQLVIDPSLREGASQLLAKAGVTVDPSAEELPLESLETLIENFDRGDIVGLAILGPVPSPIVTGFLAKTGDRAVLLELAERHVLADGRGWRPLQIPAASYPGIDRPAETFGNEVMLVAEADVTDDVVYRITKTMFDNLPKLGQMHDLAAQITIDRALAEVDVPLHPGAARYYREIGVLPYEAGAPKDDSANH